MPRAGPSAELESAVDTPLSSTELKAVRSWVDRSCPLGDEDWIKEMANRHGLWHTLRPVERPRKLPEAEA